MRARRALCHPVWRIRQPRGLLTVGDLPSFGCAEIGRGHRVLGWKRMSYLYVAALGEIALTVGYAVAVLLVIAGVGGAILKLAGRRPGRTPHRRGATGAGEEEIHPDDGTPH